MVYFNKALEKMDSFRLIGLLLLFAVTVCSAEHQHQNASLTHKTREKRMYICPPEYIRIGQHCYYFSKDMQTWQQAFFECQDRHGEIAVIRNAKEDRTLKAFLNNKNLVPLERWIGGIYDWEQMLWKWASSGKRIRYQGFSRVDPYDKESLRWHCVIMDPAKQFKWSSRSCVHNKHYICQKRIQAVNKKERQKLKRKYKVNKDHRLNEIPIPTDNRPNEIDRNLKPNNGRQRLNLDLDNNNELNTVAYARRNNETVMSMAKGRGKGRNGQNRNNRNRNGGERRRNGNRRRNQNQTGDQNQNGPQMRSGDERNNDWQNRRDRDHYRKRRNKSKESGEHGLKPKTIYRDDIEINSLHPQVIVEDVDIPRF